MSSFKPNNTNATNASNTNTNHFLSGSVNKPIRRPAEAAPNSFSSLRSFISPPPGDTTSPSLVNPNPPPPSTAAAATTPYDKNVDFPTLTPTKVASSPSPVVLSYRTAVMTSTTVQQAQQARIQKEIEQELKAKEKAYEQIRRDAARSRDVANALAAAASYDISDISESVIGCDASIGGV